MNAPTGAFRRHGVSRHGSPFVETENVVWLQVEDVYADSRGFAGTTSYDGQCVTWRREVGPAEPDSAELSDRDGRLLESGDGYAELWDRLPSGPSGAWAVAGIRVVRVGDHVVHVDASGGSHLVLS
ncbi:MAG: hypothetical protein NVS3B26_26130 [Mycobacteriales bacterium]